MQSIKLEGLNGTVSLDNYEVVIEHPRYLHLFKNKEKISIASIEEVIFKKPTFFINGYIYIMCFQTKNRYMGNMIDMMLHKKAIVFTYKQTKEFLHLKNEIERRIHEIENVDYEEEEGIRLNIRFTAVPPKETLDTEQVYYVYEWFIKDSGKVFYIGKGKGDRYKRDKNALFVKVKQAYNCDVRFVKQHLSEYDAYVLEEELFKKREDEGHVLTNIVTPGATGALFSEQEFEYMKVPRILPNRVEREYLHKTELFYDPIEKENLLFTYIKRTSPSNWSSIYLGEDSQELPNFKQYAENQMKELTEEIEQYLSIHEGRLFKSEAKSSKSVIIDSTIRLDKYEEYKQKGYDIYHLVDVLHYIRK